MRRFSELLQAKIAQNRHIRQIRFRLIGLRLRHFLIFHNTPRTRANGAINIGIGSAPKVSVADARKQAEHICAQIFEGKDPRCLKQETEAERSPENRFGAFAMQHITSLRDGSKTPSTPNNGAKPSRPTSRLCLTCQPSMDCGPEDHLVDKTRTRCIGVGKN